MKRYHIEILLFLILVIAFFYGGIMLYSAVKPVHTIIHPIPSRNEWGQIPLDNLEELCQGTILQWSIRCTEIVHRENLRKDI